MRVSTGPVWSRSVPRQGRGISAGSRARTTPAVAAARLLRPAPAKLIVLVGEEHVEAGERAVAAGDVALELDLRVLGHVHRIDLLLERAEAVPEHHHLVEERLDGPRLFLQARRTGAEHQLPVAPLVGRRDGRQPGLLADDAPQQKLEIRGIWTHARRCPFAFADEGERVAARGGG